MKRLLIIGAAGIAALGAVLTTSASTPKASLNISPRFVSAPGDGPGGCSFTGSWVCHVTLRNPSSSTASVPWEAIGSNDLVATVKPTSGTLAPGTSVRVTITTSTCGGYYDLGMFLGFSYAAGDWNYGGAVMYACG
jgi:hypothetical protein